MAKFRVNSELYEMPLTQRKDDRIARIVSTGSSTVDILIKKAATRRTDLNPITLKAGYEIIREIALEDLCEGKQVEFGFSHYGLVAEGVLIGDHAKWNDETNRLVLRATPAVDVRNAIKDIDVNVLGMASSGAYINTVTDVSSGEVNTRLTAGGGINLTGVKIKVAGDFPEIGIYLTDVNTTTVFSIPRNSILINDPSKISFIVPADLPVGDYKLSIVTQYTSSGATLLKEPRICVFDYILASI